MRLSFIRHEGSKVIQQKSRTKVRLSLIELLRHPEIIPDELLFSIAHFRLISGCKCKPYSGLIKKCKFVSGLSTKNCQLISGRHMFVRRGRDKNCI